MLNNKKFDLRVWVVVPCWNPLQVNFYKQCYVRFATSDYDPHNLKNLYSHLTNNSIQKNNMMTIDELKKFLGPGKWEKRVLPQMRDIIRVIFNSLQGYVDWDGHRVGIYGLDLMLDETLKMWLIEVNKTPSMAHSTEIVAKLVPKFMEDMVKILVDGADETPDLELVLHKPFVEPYCKEDIALPINGSSIKIHPSSESPGETEQNHEVI